MRALLPLPFALACAAADAPLPICEAEPSWSADTTPPPPGDFPQLRLEPRHLGGAPAGTAIGPGLQLTWKSEPFAIGDYSASKGSPVLADGVVYAGFDDGHLRALEAATGALRWSHATPRAAIEADEAAEFTEHKGIHGTPAVADGRVFIGDYAGWLTALDAGSGELMWEVKLGGSIGASPVVHDGEVFVAVEYPDPDGRAFVLDAAEGCVLRQTERLGDHPHSTTSLDPDRGLLFVGANNGRLHAYDYVAGAGAWDAWMDDDPALGAAGAIKSTPAVGPDTVYVTSWDHRLHALDSDTGAERFTVQADDRSMSSPSLTGDRILFGAHDGHLRAVDASDGGPLWSTDLGRTVTSSPTVVEGSGVALVGAHDGALHMLDLETGEELWAHALDGVVSSVPAAVGGTVLATDAAGVVWRFDMP